MSKFYGKQLIKKALKGVLKNPFFSFFKRLSSKGRKKPHLMHGGFSFGVISCILLGLLCFGSQGLAQLDSFQGGEVFVSPFLDNRQESVDPFIAKAGSSSAETPDLKLIQDSFVYGVSTPTAIAAQILGGMVGGISQNRTETQEHVVGPNETSESIARDYGITVTTLLAANGLSRGSTLRVGQELAILPGNGVLHLVKRGDNISSIAQYYKSTEQKIVEGNPDLTAEGNIFIGDVVYVPDGVTPPKALPSINVEVQVADSFFITPTEGKITQGYRSGHRGFDVANKCGTPIYAPAAGTVQRAKFDRRYGNYITIEHSNGVSTYLGHLQSMFVKSGDQVNVGDRIGLMGSTGTYSTGCHLHYEVRGAKNPLAKFSVGTTLQYK